MLQKEFEERIGRSVSEQEYVEADAMYMAAGDMDKDEFCREWMKIGSSHLVQSLSEECHRLNGLLNAKAKEVEDLQGNISAMGDFLLDMRDAYNDNGFVDEARWLLGEREVVVRKLRRCMTLTDTERDYIVEHLK